MRTVPYSGVSLEAGGGWEIGNGSGGNRKMRVDEHVIIRPQRCCLLAGGHPMSSSHQHLCVTGCGNPGSLCCSRCEAVFDCGVDCQTVDWPSQKGPCKAAAAAV